MCEHNRWTTPGVDIEDVRAWPRSVHRRQVETVRSAVVISFDSKTESHSNQNQQRSESLYSTKAGLFKVGLSYRDGERTYDYLRKHKSHDCERVVVVAGCIPHAVDSVGDEKYRDDHP